VTSFLTDRQRLVVDGTLGLGGHSERLLQGGARVVGIDRDPEALQRARGRLAPFGDAFQGVQGNFRDIRPILDELGIEWVDGALVDLGVSSLQLDTAERGFSFRQPGPLDMRMGPDAESLEELLHRVDAKELARIISRYGEERWAGPIAKAILRKLPDLRTPADLADVVGQAIPRGAWPKGIHPATRTFQGLRIAANDELGALDAWLEALPQVLAPGGRAVVISFHSLEDRAVKRAFAELAHPCKCPPGLPVCGCGAAEWKVLTRKVVVPGEDEVARNPRSRSSKLRVLERL
jgi:16S rRNA (cytosine1402-N4)-methyltransferase